MLRTSGKEERNNIYSVIKDQITDKPVVREDHWRETAGQGRAIDYCLYRFHVSFLEKLALTFPQAEWSDAAEKYRKKHLYEEVMSGPVPELEIPGFVGELYDYQKIGTKFIEDELEEFLAVMLNDDVGLGKTVMVLAAICRSIRRYKRVLVITTNSGKWSWKKVAHDHEYIPGKKKPKPPKFPDLDVVPIDGPRSKRHRQIAEGRRITVINTDMLRIENDGKMSYPELFSEHWDLIVVDEYHKFKNPDAQVSRGFLKLDGREFIVMSGTPFLNRPEELWSVFNRVDPEMWPDYDTFVAKLPIYGSDGKPIGYNREMVKEVKTFLGDHSIRRRKKDVDVEFPEELPPMLMPVELTSEQWNLYVKLRDEFLLALEDGSVKTVFHALAHITRMKQACVSPELYGGSKHSAKIEKLKEVVDQLVASGEKAIIFSQWSTATRIFQRELEEYNPAYVDGDVLSKNRPAQEDKFNNDPTCKLYIGTIGANQESITLGAATYVIFVDQEWNPYKMHQAFGRSAGGGLRGVWAKDKKIYRIELRAVNTIEEWIDEVLANKGRLFSSFIEKDGGTMIKRATVTEIKKLLRGQVGTHLKEAA